MGIGFDFGTTNSSVAQSDASGRVSLAVFETSGGVTEAYRSLLYLKRIEEAGRKILKSWSGPFGIEQYLASDDEKGRLVQSLKSFLASRGLQTTEVFGKTCAARGVGRKNFARRTHVGGEGVRSSDPDGGCGRPVRFVGAQTDEDDEYAITRLIHALHKADFENVRFEFEPIGAAYHYESKLDHDELILIGDFGGGTSDFSLLNVGPSYRKRESEPRSVLGQ